MSSLCYGNIYTHTQMWESRRAEAVSCVCDEEESRSLILLITHVQLLSARWRRWLRMPQKRERRSSAGGVCGWFSGQAFVKTFCCVFIFSVPLFFFFFQSRIYAARPWGSAQGKASASRRHTLPFSTHLKTNLSTRRRQQTRTRPRLLKKQLG